MKLSESGCELVALNLDPALRAQLRDKLFKAGRAGTRCLLDELLVKQAAILLRRRLVDSGHLADDAVAIQAIAFDKTAETNWKVSWHQDLMFPFAQAVTTPGFDLGTRKGGIDYARPPQEVLERLLAVRLHLDDCDETNGPLRLIPGSHLHGILKVDDIPNHVAVGEAHACLATEGVALLMRPLTLHASSQALEPKHRRVLHFVYDTGEPIAEEWHRRV